MPFSSTPFKVPPEVFFFFDPASTIANKSTRKSKFNKSISNLFISSSSSKKSLSKSGASSKKSLSTPSLEVPSCSAMASCTSGVC